MAEDSTTGLETVLKLHLIIFTGGLGPGKQAVLDQRTSAFLTESMRTRLSAGEVTLHWLSRGGTTPRLNFPLVIFVVGHPFS